MTLSDIMRLSCNTPQKQDLQFTGVVGIGVGNKQNYIHLHCIGVKADILYLYKKLKYLHGRIPLYC